MVFRWHHSQHANDTTHKSATMTPAEGVALVTAVTNNANLSMASSTAHHRDTATIHLQELANDISPGTNPLPLDFPVHLRHIPPPHCRRRHTVYTNTVVIDRLPRAVASSALALAGRPDSDFLLTVRVTDGTAAEVVTLPRPPRRTATPGRS